MALTESIEYDKIEVIGQYKHVHVRKATVIKKDGEELTRSFHRHVLEPSVKNDDTWGATDISSEDAKVQTICNAVWTDEVKTAFQEMRDGQSNLGD